MKLDRASSIYARLLGVLSIIGMILLFATFILYAFELIPSAVTPEKITQLWHLDVGSFHDVTATPVGWAWVGEILTGSGITFAALVFLAFSSLVCLVSLIPIYLTAKDSWYLAIVLLQVAVLAVAASGSAVVH